MRFRKNALLANLCKEWDGMWAACHGEKEKLMRLVLMCQSAPYFAVFCHNGDGLTKDYCKREFGEYINGRVFDDCDHVAGFTYQMFIDAPEYIFLHSDVAQFLWCKTEVEVNETKCPRLYISNGSEVRLVLNGYNSPSVYLFDDSKVIIEDADETSKAVVYRFSDEAVVERGRYCLTDNIKTFRKEIRL